jgi:DNA-directed RNA polymerase specialized sigma24 family protein
MDNGTAHHQDPNVLYHDLSSDELVERSQGGDAQALEQLYYNNRDQLLKFAWMVTGNQDIAVEAVNHTFRQLFEQLGSLGAAQSVTLFLYQQLCLSIHDQDPDPISSQGNWELTTDSIAGEGDWTGPGSPPELTPETEQFVDCFSSLPEPLRMSAGLRLIGLFSINDIIQISDETAEAIRARLDEALRRLRVCLQGDDATTHTGNCSIAGERTWLQFTTGNSDRSGSSDLSAHRKQCEECQMVQRGIERLMEHVRHVRDVELAAFPKGDESDLLQAARETAVRMVKEEPEGPDMDPDLKQVLYLIPWGLALLLVIPIAPLFVQEHPSNHSPDVSDQSPRSASLPVVLRSGEHKIKTVRIRVTSTVKARDLRTSSEYESAQISTRRVESDVSDAGSQLHHVDVTFSPPFPSGNIHVMNLQFSGTDLPETNQYRLDVLQATNQDGKTVPVEAIVKE